MLLLAEGEPLGMLIQPAQTFPLIFPPLILTTFSLELSLPSLPIMFPLIVPPLMFTIFLSAILPAPPVIAIVFSPAFIVPPVTLTVLFSAVPEKLGSV